MSNEIGDLKIRVGVEVDTADAKKQHDKVASDAAKAEHSAALKSQGFWAAASRAIGIRQKAAENESADARVKRETEAARASAAAWDQGFQRSGQIIAGSIAAGALGIAAFARELYSSGLAIDRQSRQLGVSARTFQQWGYIAEQAGIEQNALSASIAHMQQQASAAGDNRGASELFADAADQIERLGPGTRATALAMRMFGEQGRALLPTLLQGRQGIERLSNEFDTLGGGIDDNTVQSIAELDRTLNRAKQQLMALVMPIVREAVPAMREFAGKIGGVIERFKETVNRSHVLRAGIIALGATMAGVGAAVAVAWAPVIVTLGAIIVGAAALGLVIDDIVTTFEGGDSVIRRVIDSLYGVGATTEVVQQLRDAWEGLTSLFEGVGADADTLLLAMGPVGLVFKAIKDNIGWILQKLPQMISLMVRLSPLGNLVQGLASIGGARRRAREANAPAAPVASALTAPGFGVLAAAPAMTGPATAGGPGSASSRVVHGNQRVTVNVSGMLDAASTRMIGDVVNQAVADANQAAVDDLATTGDEH